MHTLNTASYALALSAALLAGCNDTSRDSDLNPDTALNDSNVALQVPGTIVQVRQIDLAALRPEVTLDGTLRVPMRRGENNRWTGSLNVPANRRVNVSIRWIESVSGRDLTLAELLTSANPGDSGTEVQVDAGSYDVSFDFDKDGITNLDERRNETDPFVPTDDGSQDPGNPVPGEPTTPEVPPEPSPTPEPTPLPEPEPDIPDNVQVIVPRVGSLGAPRIDGLGAELDGAGRLTGEWAAAVQKDRNGTQLTINNLMIDLRSEGPNGSPYRRWAAMHDDDYLYVLVLVDDNGDRQGDSFFHFEDDSLELFLDGDNSKNRFYGDRDDFHFLIPMLPLNGGSKTPNTSEDGRASRGLFSSTRSFDLSFATGPGVGPDGLRRPRYEQDVYELRIGLDRARIEVNRPFGLELQVNDDDRGIDRDSKWGWFHPARERRDIDFTTTDPSVMGTLILQP